MKLRFWLHNLLFLALIGLLFFLLVPQTFAHPGRTDSLGCHTCRTNCPRWGLYYGQYHCHNSKPSYYTTPTCPLFSSYNYLSKSCECWSGYLVSGNSCISANTYCVNRYGVGARYNSLSNSCECSYNYVYKNGICQWNWQ